MAEGDSRQNKVYKAMNRPLTILGAERRLFFVALITGGAIFSSPSGRASAACGIQAGA